MIVCERQAKLIAKQTPYISKQLQPSFDFVKYMGKSQCKLSKITIKKWEKAFLLCFSLSNHICGDQLIFLYYNLVSDITVFSYCSIGKNYIFFQEYSLKLKYQDKWKV